MTSEESVACINAAKEITLAVCGTQRCNVDNPEFNAKITEVINQTFASVHATIVASVKRRPNA